MAYFSRAEHMMNATQELERWSTASKFSVAVAALRHKLDRRTNSSNFLATAGSTEQADLVLRSSEDIQLYLLGGPHTAPAWPALKQAFNFDMLKRRKSGSKDDAAARDSTMSHPSTTSPRSRPAGAPVIGPASAPQRKLRQAVKGSGRHLLLTCCLHPRCDGNEDSPLDSQQQLQKTSYQGSSDSCAVGCEVFLRSPQPQQMKQHLEQQQESSECQPCCAGPIIPVAEPVTSAAGTSSTQPRTACSPAQHARCTCRALTTTARSALKQAFNFDMLKQRKSGSKEDAAASDNTMSQLSATSPRSSTAGAPVSGPASAPQRKLWQAVKASGSHLLLSLRLRHPRCDSNEESSGPLDSQQQLQKTSYQGSSDNCAVDCEVFLRSLQPLVNQSSTQD
jgi:hypothetical protein